MKEVNSNTYKFKNGSDLLLGQDIYDTYIVSCLDADMNIVWVMKFDKEAEAIAQFEHSKKVEMDT